MSTSSSALSSSSLSSSSSDDSPSAQPAAHSSSLPFASAAISSTPLATSLSSVYPIMFIPTIQGSSSFFQEAPSLYVANFDTPDEANVYMRALVSAHTQFMHLYKMMKTNTPPQNQNGSQRGYTQTSEVLNDGVLLIKEKWLEGEWSPPSIPNGTECGTVESDGYLTRVTRVPSETAFEPASSPSAASQDDDDEL